MRLKIKHIFMILILILIIVTIILSYQGLLFFNRGFNEFDCLMLNILGDGILVGIVTHISSKNIALYISKKEFDRNSKINITINEARNSIINYECFMRIYENQESYFALERNDQKTVDYIYKLYDYLLNTLKCEGIEKQLLDAILNIPFSFKYYADENIIESYKEILEKFDSENRFNNISILKLVLKDEDIKKTTRIFKNNIRY